MIVVSQDHSGNHAQSMLSEHVEDEQARTCRAFSPRVDLRSFKMFVSAHGCGRRSFFPFSWCIYSVVENTP